MERREEVEVERDSPKRAPISLIHSSVERGKERED